MSGVNFASPSYRASSSDLTIAISPLGLVELADEEFEVHGPRLNRYAQNYAFYLGRHWSHRREIGENQTTFNYTKAFADYINNFTFGKGVWFSTPTETEGIIPRLLHRVWHKDNDMHRVLWEAGNQGGVAGDVFCKVAYEEPWVDPVGRPHPGKVRVLPLNPSYCFPEYHPHDRSRLIRFKMKYRFWGTAAEGTRQVFTYVELLTEQNIEEYVNDELISSRPNPLGTIPVVPIPNILVPSSPWGMSDIQDIIPINREFNEKAAEISDIINYSAAPVTVITGAKASQLERGPRKIWGGLPSDAKVFNLESGGEGVSAAYAYLEFLKLSMHELTGVPEGALGQALPVSNTSGVALAMAYQPLMNRRDQKKVSYGYGLKEINKLILLTLAVKEPWQFQWDPTQGVELKPGQMPVLDPMNPLVYETEVIWPQPLPLDELIVLQQAGLELELGLNSRRGILRKLGVENPDKRMLEIFEERKEEELEMGAVGLITATNQVATQLASGAAALGAEQPTDAEGNPVGGPPPIPPMVDMVAEQLAARAYGSPRPEYPVPSSS